MIDKQKLIQKAAKAGLTIDAATADRFDRYAYMLVEKNKQVNLTAITDPEGILNKHFLDSILPLSELDLPIGAKVIDVGTGAGFPGIPMKLLRPDLDLILLDSLQKRVMVLEGFCKELGLTDVCCLHGRAEEAGRGELRETFDLVTSRAVARMNKLCEYCLPLVKPGGVFAALKGPTAAEENDEAARAVSILGGKLRPLIQVNIPDTDLSHVLAVVEKVSPTPDKYPRGGGKIAAKPL